MLKFQVLKLNKKIQRTYFKKSTPENIIDYLCKFH